MCGRRVSCWPSIFKTEPMEPNKESVSRRNLLVVEDDPFFRMLMKRMLEKQNIACTFADGGAKAITVLNSGLAVTDIILDLNMPDLDGLSLIAYLNEQARHQHINIFVCSGEPEDLFIKRAGSKSIATSIVKQYFSKPVDFPLLVAALQYA